MVTCIKNSLMAMAAALLMPMSMLSDDRVVSTGCEQLTRTMAFMPGMPVKSHYAAGLVSVKPRVEAVERAPGVAAAVAPANLFGCVIYSDDPNRKVGIYTVPQNEDMDFELVKEGVNANRGGTKVGNVYWAVSQEDYYWYSIKALRSYDADTWNQLSVVSDDGVTNDLMAYCTAVHPQTNVVYGCFYDASGRNPEFGTVDYATCSRTLISALDEEWNACAFAPDGTLYAISWSGSLYTVNIENGVRTLVGATGAVSSYTSGAVIDPRTGRMFWNVTTQFSSALYEVDLTTGKAEMLYKFPTGEEVVGLYVGEPLAEDDAPAKVKDLSVAFTSTSLTGTVSFTAPVKTFAGVTGEGELAYTVKANDKTVATGTVTYGEPVSAEVTVERSGLYDFTVTVSNKVGSGPEATVSAYVGYDTPVMGAVTLDVDGATANVSWPAVTKGSNGDLPADAVVSYNVTRYPGAVQVAEGQTGTSFSEAVPPVDAFTIIYYEVSAQYADAVSVPSRSNAHAIGDLVPPVTETFDTPEGAAIFKIVNSNGDNRTWSYASEGYMRYTYNVTSKADDWLITAPVVLESGKIYTVELDAWNSSDWYAEKFEVKWGTAATAEAMTNTLIEPTEMIDGKPKTFSAVMAPESDGRYYIGIHAISDAACQFLHVDNFKIHAGVSLSAPNVVTDVRCVPDYNGAASVELRFNAPSVTVEGKELQSLTKIEVSRGEKVIRTLDQVAPGQQYSVVDNAGVEGTYEYTVTAYNENGAGRALKFSGRVGVAVPAPPVDVAITEAGHSGRVTVSWKAPEGDADGNPLNPALVTYSITDGNNYIVERIKDTAYAFQAVEEGKQGFVQYTVYAVTDGGMSYTVTPFMTVGQPYGLPYADSFADGKIKYNMATTNEIDPGKWLLCNDASFSNTASYDGDNGFMCMQGQGIGHCSSMWTGKIGLGDAANPTLSLAVYKLGDSNANTLEILVAEENDEFNPIVKMEMNELASAGWNKVYYPLNSYKGKAVSIKLIATSQSYAYTIIDAVRVADRYDHDLVAGRLVVPERAEAGAPMSMTVDVANEGVNEAAGYSVSFRCNGKEIANAAGQRLAVGQRVTVGVTYTPTVADEGDNVFDAVVVYDKDMNVADNTSAAITVPVAVAELPRVGDLSAKMVNGQVELSWSEPDMSSLEEKPYTETFETGTPWADEFAGWTFVNADQSPIGGVGGIRIPGHTAGESTMSFCVYDASENGSLPAHGGSKYLITVSGEDEQATDNWAISPELSGKAQTVRFHACQYTSDFPKKLTAYVSQSGSGTGEFAEVREFMLSDNWAEYSFDLPEGARYFAIRSQSDGLYFAMIDDVTFIPADNPNARVQVTGYHVYRDGVRITDAPVTSTEYVDAHTAGGRYAVSVVYDCGESGLSNVASVSSGIDGVVACGVTVSVDGNSIIVTGATGVINVYALDGTLQATEPAVDINRIPVRTGVYIVRAGNHAVKLMVR